MRVRICASRRAADFSTAIRSLHDHAVVAIAALHGLFVDHGLLDGMQRGRLASFFCAAYQAGSPSSVVTDFPPTADTGVTHERVSTPFTSTEHEPHCANPQPKRGPCSLNSSKHVQQRRVGSSINGPRPFVYLNFDSPAIREPPPGALYNQTALDNRLSNQAFINQSFFRCQRNPKDHAGTIMATDLVNLSDELAATVERAAASIVAVHARRGVGSSGISWRDNLILTSSEGVRVEEGIKLLLPDGRVSSARLRGRDSGTDLAVLETDASGLPALEFAGDIAFKAGQLAIAVGRTANTGPIASFGIISGVSANGKHGAAESWIRLFVSISLLIRRSRAARLWTLRKIDWPGLYWSFAQFRICSHGQHHRSNRGKIEPARLCQPRLPGVALQPVALPPETKEKLEQDSGIMLLGIEPEGPGAMGGLILGDVLVAADGPPLAQADALAELLEGTPAGQVMKFQVLRAGAVQELDVRIGERPRRKS